MPTSSIVHLDSINATLVTDKNNTSGVSKSYYNCQFNLNNIYRNVKSVKLLSLELPVAFPNIRTNSNNQLKVLMDGITYTYNIPQNNYTSIQSIISALPANISGYLFQWSVLGDYLNVICNSNNLVILDTPFSNNILGFFSSDGPYNPGRQIFASGRWSLNCDSYISLYIPEIGTNGNNSKITYKIPLPVSTSQVLYLTENIFYSQTINCNIPTLNTLTCKFYDRFGADLTSSGYAWSASIELITE